MEIKDIIERQNKGQLEFSISDLSLETKILKAQDVDYTNSNQYVWSGNAQDDSFSATFIKEKNGYSGSISDYTNRYIYRIYPVTPTVSAMMKMDNAENPPTCCTEPFLQPKGEPITEDCEPNYM